jgi:hypothetical protein
LEQTKEYADNKLTNSYGECFIRGNNGIIDLLMKCCILRRFNKITQSFDKQHVMKRSIEQELMSGFESMSLAEIAPAAGNYIYLTSECHKRMRMDDTNDDSGSNMDYVINPQILISSSLRQKTKR